MEGKALQEPPFRVRLVPCDRFVERGDSLHHGNDVGALRVLVPQTVVLEEPPAQHFGHVLLADGLHALFALPPEDVEQFRLQPLADLVALLLRIGRQQRRHHRRPIHLRDRLRQILKEVDDPVAPDRVGARLLAGVHQHLVHQNQGRQAACLRAFEQRDQERLGRWRVPFLGLTGTVDGSQPVRTAELEGEHAPGVA